MIWWYGCSIFVAEKVLDPLFCFIPFVRGCWWPAKNNSLQRNLPYIEAKLALPWLVACNPIPLCPPSHLKHFTFLRFTSFPFLFFFFFFFFLFHYIIYLLFAKYSQSHCRIFEFKTLFFGSSLSFTIFNNISDLLK